MELRIGMRSQYHLKTMVRIRNGSNTNPERIECPFYGDYIFSYKGDIRFHTKSRCVKNAD